jgi:hypothetical protein
MKRVKQKRLLTEITLFLVTPVSGTVTTSFPDLTLAELITILSVVLASENSLEDTTGVITGPLFPKLDSSSGHRSGKERLRLRSR